MPQGFMYLFGFARGSVKASVGRKCGGLALFRTDHRPWSRRTHVIWFIIQLICSALGPRRAPLIAFIRFIPIYEVALLVHDTHVIFYTQKRTRQSLVFKLALSGSPFTCSAVTVRLKLEVHLTHWRIVCTLNVCRTFDDGTILCAPMCGRFRVLHVK